MLHAVEADSNCSLDGAGSVYVRGDFLAVTMGLVGERGEFGVGKRLHPRVVADGHDSSGRIYLDPVGAILEFAAYGFANRVFAGPDYMRRRWYPAVGSDAVAIAMSTQRADRVRRHLHPRTHKQTLGERIAQHDRPEPDVAVARHPQSREALPQHRLRIFEAGKRFRRT